MTKNLEVKLNSSYVSDNRLLGSLVVCRCVKGEASVW